MNIVVGILGLGLIGGSIGLKLKKSCFVDKIIGTDSNQKNAFYAKKIGIVEEIVPLQDLIRRSTLIIISIPIDKIVKILPNILDLISINTVVLDTGSTKYDICKSVFYHPKRSRFVATHPIAGVENSGPNFSDSKIFYKKNCIICDSELSDPDAISITKKIYSLMKIGMIYNLSSKEHDLYISYLSHLPHVISFSLSNLILNQFENQKEVFNNMIGSGFHSTTRLSKSNPDTWLPIFISNRKNLIQSLNFYIDYLNLFRKNLLNKKFKKIFYYMKKANGIIEKS